MANSYLSCHIHYIFSTKNRQPLLLPDIQKRLCPYLGAIARKNKMKALAVGGIEDHTHILLSLSPTISISESIRLIKGQSSLWLHETFPALHNFSWQEGYGAFSVSMSQLDKTIAYIKGQSAHHRRKTFQEEYLSFLKKHRVPYKERYLWD